MHTFEQNITVVQDDLDELNHVNNVRYVQWINDIGKAHWYHEATTNMLDNYVWVVLQHHIDYKSAAFLNDVIKLKTYVILTKGAICTRVVEMFNETTNKRLAKSETKFCLLSKASQKPVRITKEMSDLLN